MINVFGNLGGRTVLLINHQSILIFQVRLYVTMRLMGSLQSVKPKRPSALTWNVYTVPGVRPVTITGFLWGIVSSIHEAGVPPPLGTAPRRSTKLSAFGREAITALS